MSALHRSLRQISQEGLVWRANEDDPRKHTEEHEALFYKLPDDNKPFGQVSPFGYEPTKFNKIIGFSPIMIRKPALSAMNYIRQTTPTMPNVRVVFYGDPGHGKQHTLAHLIHYLHTQQEHIIIHVRETRYFTRYIQELGESKSRPGRIDTPLYAAILLQQFRLQNSKLLENESLVCSQDYVWSSREKTKAGEPLINIAEHGVNRVIHASDCVAALFKELMLASDSGKIKLATFIDDVRLLFQREAGVLKHADKKQVLVDEITVSRSLKKLIKGNYRGGLLFVSCDNKKSTQQNQTLQQVLGEEGWDYFDPFLPIHVPKYSRNEFENCLNMYQDIGWLSRPESRTCEVREELRFISGMNPEQVFYLCQSI